MDFKITIEDQRLLDGITWARNQYNTHHDALLAEDNDYVSYIMNLAAKSYADQREQKALTTMNVDGKVAEAIAAAQEGDFTKFDALRDEFANPNEAIVAKATMPLTLKK